VNYKNLSENIEAEMIERMIVLLINLMLFSAIFAQTEPEEHFGRVLVQINDEPEETFFAESAELYRSVSIDYDTTVYLRDENFSEMLFSPQLSKGNDNILHLILKSAEVGGEDRVTSYDVYFNLGDTLWEQLQILDADSLVFIHPDGILTENKLYSANQTGQFNLVASEGGSQMGGTFQTEFDFPVPGRAEPYSRVQLRGELNIPESQFRLGEETVIKEAGLGKKNRARNIVFAILLSAFIVLFAVR
jgi:hypothetical protein